MKRLSLCVSASALSAAIILSGPALAIGPGGAGGHGGGGHMGGGHIGGGGGHMGGMHVGGGGFEGRSVGFNRGHDGHWHGYAGCLPPYYYYCNGY
jgi:hypothetical protein